MKKLKKLIALCEGNNFNCSLTYQRSTKFSVEIYAPNDARFAFYTDGHIKPQKAIKKGLKAMKKIRRAGLSFLSNN